MRGQRRATATAATEREPTGDWSPKVPHGGSGAERTAASRLDHWATVQPGGAHPGSGAKGGGITRSDGQIRPSFPSS